MHGMHARLPRNFVLEERLDRYANAIELEPKTWAGRWAQACWPLDAGRSGAEKSVAAGQKGASDAPTTSGVGQMGTNEAASLGAFREVRLDLGCGKGAFVVEAARREPDVLFVAMDAEPLCIAYTAQHIVEAGLPNAVVVPALGSAVHQAFGAGELACIYLNFPTPYPRKKEAHKRLVALDRLLEYRHALTPGGTLRLRTDSLPLRDFTLTQLQIAGYDVVWSSNDERADRPNEPISEYEQRLATQGAKVYGIWATPGPEPSHVEQTASLSLVDYLPTDLSSMDYVPHGMQGAVTNLRNRRLHEQGR